MSSSELVHLRYSGQRLAVANECKGSDEVRRIEEASEGTKLEYSGVIIVNHEAGSGLYCIE